MIPGGKPLKRDRTQRKMQSGRRNRMVIECIGLPKSGKTDLIELVEKEFALPYFEFVYDEHWDLGHGWSGDMVTSR